MKKVLGLIGSPRKAGNSEIAIKEISNNISEDHELKLLRLKDFKILPCQACYTCILKDYCPQEDDYKLVLDAMREADAIIIAAPCYLLGPNASIKLFLDRCLQIYTYLDEIWGKPGITVSVAGIEGQEGHTNVALSIMAKFLGLDVKENAVFFSALPGEILLNEKNKAKLAHLGQVLFEKEYVPEQKNYLCPICSSDTFQFIGENQIKCMVCRHTGTISQKDHGTEVNIEPNQDVFFMSYERSMQHKEWLKTMKDKFLEKRKELNQVSENYKHIGQWIKPGE